METLATYLSFIAGMTFGFVAGHCLLSAFLDWQDRNRRRGR